jgi:DNA invertase Pin-like site-specific DNA recombinase
MDEMMGKFAAWMTEFEREMIRLRIQSGVERAAEQGKWTGRPPYGFSTNDEGYLTLEPEEFLAMSNAVELVVTGRESVRSASRHLDVPQSTLSRIKNDEERRKLYLYGEHDDDRLAGAVENADAEPESELAELRERVERLEREDSA